MHIIFSWHNKELQTSYTEVKSLEESGTPWKLQYQSRQHALSLMDKTDNNFMCLIIRVLVEKKKHQLWRTFNPEHDCKQSPQIHMSKHLKTAKPFKTLRQRILTTEGNGRISWTSMCHNMRNTKEEYKVKYEL